MLLLSKLILQVEMWCLQSEFERQKLKIKKIYTTLGRGGPTPMTQGLYI